MVEVVVVGIATNIQKVLLCQTVCLKPCMYLILIIMKHCEVGVISTLYWVGQKVCSGFSITPCGKTQMNLLAIPVFLSSFFYEEECSYSEASMCQAQYILF